ncbi:MAG: energy transducer TonB [Pseudomonadota bacterium]
MAYADQQMGGSRMTSIFFVAVIHVAVGYLLISGLAISAVKEIAQRVTAVDIEEPEEPPEEPEEPPPPEEIVEPPPVVPPPPIPQLNQNNNFEAEQNLDPPPPPPPQPAPAPPAAEPAPPAPPSQARGATTRNERRWASRIQENYPSRALREEVEGTVGVSVTVTPKGRATNCQVTASSGSSVLDRAACRGMERYARFNPALDRDGNETTGRYSTRITYRLN